MSKGLVRKGPGKLVEVQYIGMFDKVSIPSAGDDVSVEKGGVVKVPAEMAKSLCEQKSNWKLADAPAKSQPKADAPATEDAVEGPAAAEE